MLLPIPFDVFGFDFFCLSATRDAGKKNTSKKARPLHQVVEQSNLFIASGGATVFIQWVSTNTVLINIIFYFVSNFVKMVLSSAFVRISVSWAWHILGYLLLSKAIQQRSVPPFSVAVSLIALGWLIVEFFSCFPFVSFARNG